MTPWSGRTTMGRRLRPEHPRRKGGRAPCAEAGGPNASGAPLPPRPSRPGTVGADGATARGPGLRGSASRARPQRRRRSPNRSSRLTGRASGCRSWRCPCWRRHRRPPPLGVHHRSLVLEQPPRPRAAHYTSAARPAHHLLVDVGPVDEDAHVDPRRAATTNSSTSLTGGKLAVVNQSRVRAPAMVAKNIASAAALSGPGQTKRDEWWRRASLERRKGSAGEPLAPRKAPPRHRPQEAGRRGRVSRPGATART